MRDRDVVRGLGDLFVVPKGVEHCPTTDSEARFIILGTSVTSNAAGGKPDWSYSGRTPDVLRPQRTARSEQRDAIPLYRLS
jgi:hypothetical protein